MLRRIVQLPLFGALAAFGMVACSSDEKSSNTAATVDPVTSDGGADTDDTVTDETVTEDTIDPTLLNAGIGTPFCDLNEQLNQDEGPVGGTPEEIEQYFTETFPGMVSDLADETPPVLEADVAVLLGGVEAFIEVVADNDWDLDAAYADPALEAAIATDEFTAAGERIDAYCGL